MLGINCGLKKISSLGEQPYRTRKTFSVSAAPKTDYRMNFREIPIKYQTKGCTLSSDVVPIPVKGRYSKLFHRAKVLVQEILSSPFHTF